MGRTLSAKFIKHSRVFCPFFALSVTVGGLFVSISNENMCVSNSRDTNGA